MLVMASGRVQRGESGDVARSILKGWGDQEKVFRMSSEFIIIKKDG